MCRLKKLATVLTLETLEGNPHMPYRYIERAYGKTFEQGQRVRFTECERGLGVVRGVRDDPKYVKVLFDDGHVGDCHPGSVEVVG